VDSQLAKDYVRPIQQCIDVAAAHISQRPWHGVNSDVVRQAEERLTQLVNNNVALHHQRNPDREAELGTQLAEANRKLHLREEVARLQTSKVQQLEREVHELKKLDWQARINRLQKDLAKANNRLHNLRQAKVKVLNEKALWQVNQHLVGLAAAMAELTKEVPRGEAAEATSTRNPVDPRHDTEWLADR
jgi:hypothetical protein